MADQVAGFPFWAVRFDERGRFADPPAVERFVAELRAEAPTDLFVFSHGWNNDATMAERLYAGFFGEMRKLLDDPQTPRRRQAKIAVAGILWPSILWPDDGGGEGKGGAAGLAPGLAAGEPDLLGELAKVFTAPEQQETLGELAALLESQPRSEAALAGFKAKLDELADAAPPSAAPPDELEQQAVLTPDAEWRDLFEALADQETAESSGGAAGLGDAFARLWAGAKGALRMLTYWTMKDRAGAIGRTGLGPLLARLAHEVPGLRLHLLGHSFGARLVSYALSGLPAMATGEASPVKSLFLLQGAFSHFTFAPALPFERARAGDLVGMDARVDGPLLTTQSLKDLAIGAAYPLASMAARQDAAASDDALFRWGAMGHDGAQGVAAQKVRLGPAGTVYPLGPGQWVNLDGNRVIVRGAPPLGAHGDIVYPHTAWAALAAAGIV
jgi:hypothetical protein